MNEGWFAFGRNLLQALVQKPGVYEVADKEGKTIFIGGGKNVRSCLERLLADPDLRHVRQQAAMCHVEYRVDYQSHLQFKRMLFRDVFSYDPEGGAGDD